MDNPQILLFGQFQIYYNTKSLPNFNNRKIQELFAYLLLHQGQHHREVMANIIWENTNHTHAKNYLRKTIWQLQSTLNELEDGLSERLLQITDEWIAVKPEAYSNSDVAQFENVFTSIQDIPGKDITTKSLHTVEDTINLYQQICRDPSTTPRPATLDAITGANSDDSFVC